MTEQPLSEKRYSSMDGWDAVNKEEIKSWHYQEEDVKQAIQKTLKELKEELNSLNLTDNKTYIAECKVIHAIFKQNFGESLL